MTGDELVREYMSRIVGNNGTCEKLCRDILANKLSHAFIIEGAKGTGKHTIALNTAAAIACSQKHKGHGLPCYECHDCKKVFEGNSPDVIFVRAQEDKSTLGVDVVRFLREDIRTVPNDLDNKIYIIESADKMTEQAQNAFLLTLEEPPAFVIFILLCESSSSLLKTILSRAPVYRTEPVSREELDAFLCANDRRAQQLKLSSPKEYAELIISARNGIGEALEFLEPKKFAPVKSMRSLITEFCDAVTSQAGASVTLSFLKRFSKERETLDKQLEMLSLAIRDLLLLKRCDTAELVFFSDKDHATMLSDRASASFLYTFSEAVASARQGLAKKSNVWLTLVKMLSDAGII